MVPALGPAYRGLSLWLDQVGADTGADPATADRAPLTTGSDADADVVIVGGGLTGLWTAYYLSEADPRLDILVVEAETVGFGASGRNGGWCSALFPVSAEALARRHGEAAARAMRAAMRDTVVEVGGVAAAEEIDCGFRYGGTLTLARSEPQLVRARREAAGAARWGDEVELLSADDAIDRLGATRVLGADYTPDCARLHPGRLVQGLARAVERRGVRIAEQTRATRVAQRLEAATPAGRVTVRARHVVRATEAWTARLPGSRRAVVPVYSLMIATEPLPPDVWEVIGLRRGETFSDHRHLIVYGQRTADDRIAFGGRGAPYHWASAIAPAHDRSPRVFAALQRTLTDLFPVLRGARITHRWGGPLGIARDWNASVGLDSRTGVAWAGGYVGDGLSTTNLAGRTLADLLTGQDTPLTRLPWVGHVSPRWEPEPLRWLGVNAGLAVMTAADAEERLTGHQSTLARAVSPLLGH